ncbi:MAG: hypothetical protein PHO56_02015 [Patescibacteria group bacterium]|nr:hypothetical protein [Patescibacteria group bacterium]
MADNKINDQNVVKKEINLSRYDTDVEGLSMKKLEAGLWWAKNKKNLKIILIVFLLLIAIPSWAYTLYGFGSYLLTGMNADSQMINLFTQSKTVDQSYLDHIAAKNLILSPAGFIANDGKYDLYFQVTNPNARWWGTFNYCFAGLNGEKSCGSDFILPGEKKYVLSLSQVFSAAPNDLSYSLANVSWKKINNHVIADWNQYRAEHLNFIINSEQFTPAANNASSEKVALNALAFNLTNNSAYGYWEVPLTIVLTSGNRIVYLNHYTVSDFTSVESRDIKITWPGEIGDVTGISITPDLNILDQGVYKGP